MAERGILMSGPMVRAWMAGRKTQTRRVVKPQPELRDGAWYWSHPRYDTPALYDAVAKCALYQPGDVLWFREACRAHEREDGLDGVVYAADGAFVPIPNTQQASDAWLELHGYRGGRGEWVRSIHMPRWAARNFARVKAVRVERVQEISEEDARAEGAAFHDGSGVGHSGWRHDEESPVYESARASFAALWDSINGAKHPWSSNPWVWVYELEKLDAAP